MRIFVDTSAIHALLSASDDRNPRARRILTRLRDERADLATTNYVAVESAVLAAARLGIDGARALQGRILPLFEVIWVDPDIHAEGVAAWLGAGRRTVSLVDWISFVVMRREGIDAAFAFDRDFTAQGFQLVT